MNPTSPPPPIRKYPRTHHLEGSRLGPGDTDASCVPFRAVRGRHLVVEEKIDGANTAISFDPAGSLLLQSRGHYLTGGAREKHWDALKPWARRHATDLFGVLGDRYVMYGEWVYAKHTVYYDALPHYFLEFDILDRTTGRFLSTLRRQALLAGLPVVSVPVLASGAFAKHADLVDLVGPSRFKTAEWRATLHAETAALGLDVARALAETDPSPLAEGLYLKVETDDEVVERLKWVRHDFLAVVTDSQTHWLARPIIPNRLVAGSIEALFQPIPPAAGPP